MSLHRMDCRNFRKLHSKSFGLDLLDYLMSLIWFVMVSNLQLLFILVNDHWQVLEGMEAVYSSWPYLISQWLLILLIR